MGKKLILLSVLLTLFMLPVSANESEEVTLEQVEIPESSSKTEEVQAQEPVQSYDIPKWSEFCEQGYENAKLKDKENILNIINFVDAERTKSNYWAERRINFEKAIEHCKTLSEDTKAFCYEGVRKNETEHNEMYEQQRKQINYKNRGIIIDKPNY